MSFLNLRTLVTTFVVVATSVVRCPIFTAMTLAAKAKMDSERKEWRQEREREFARRAREERRRRKREGKEEE